MTTTQNDSGQSVKVRNFDVLPFIMNRTEDVGGTSGTGIIATGCVFSDSSTVYTVWNTETPSFTIHNSLDKAKHIHGHGGATQFIFAQDMRLNDPLKGFLPRRWTFEHTENKSGLSAVGNVAKGIVTINGFVIHKWLIYPFQLEVFTKFRDWSAVHQKDYTVFKYD